MNPVSLICISGAICFQAVMADPSLTGNKEKAVEIKPNNDQPIVVKHGGIPKSQFEDLNMAGCGFKDVNLSGSEIKNTNFSNAVFNSVNMSDCSFMDVNFARVKIHAANLEGADISAISKVPPDKDGNLPPSMPLVFNHCHFMGSQIKNSDLSNISIDSCKIAGMKINGISVEEMMESYNKSKKR
jgi:uncharacterized protein YjbI with pentapeptide repeats